jgi:hypothetical protein
MKKGPVPRSFFSYMHSYHYIRRSIHGKKPHGATADALRRLLGYLDVVVADNSPESIDFCNFSAAAMLLAGNAVACIP